MNDDVSWLVGALQCRLRFWPTPPDGSLYAGQKGAPRELAHEP